MVPKVIDHSAAVRQSGPQKAATVRTGKPAGGTVRARGGPASVAYGTVVFVDRRTWRNSAKLRVRLASIADLPAGGAPKLFRLFVESSSPPKSARELGTVVLQRVSGNDVRVLGSDESVTGQAGASSDFGGSVKIDVVDGEVWANFSKSASPAGEDASV
jgi:hypothetical protein